MERTNRNYALAVPFVAALAQLGLRHVCITPGSRNTPLTLAFAEHPDIRDWPHHDERSSAFFGLGIAKMTRAPVALVATSGTAAAEFHPAVVEARYARVPLLVLTADRPPELRDVGAAQTIDQARIYGTAAKWFHEVPPPEATPQLVRYVTALASRAWTAAMEAPPGPVQLNFPFREPLAPVEGPGDVPNDLPRPSAVRPLLGRLQLEERQVQQVAELVSGRRTLLMVGPLDEPGFPEAATALAAVGGFPILADPLSQLRAGTHDLDHVITTGDPIARVTGLADPLSPEAILRFGAAPTSKVLTTWLAENDTIPQVVVDDAGWRDPAASATVMVRSDPVTAAALLAKAITPAPSEWAATWRRAERAVRAALEARVPFPSEPGTVSHLGASLPAGSQLYVGSSMPIRDVDAFFDACDRPIRILANRGASGIDGTISSTLGAAAVAAPTFALTGDLSLLYDLTALATAARLQLPVTIIVANNDGGGIFHFLPQARFPDHFERLLATPHGLDFGRLAHGFDVEHHLVDDGDRLRELVSSPADGPRLLEVRSDRAENVRLHDELWRAAAAAL